MTRSTSSSSSSSDAFDEIAAMFMTPADGLVTAAPQDEAPEAPDSAAPITELLLVGHLPVRGNVWLAPYADAMAREIGPVALLRLDGDEPTLEIMRAPESWRAEIAGQPLHRVIELIGSEVRAWIVRPRSMDGLTESNVLNRVDRVMLLSSADQAASVAAYQTLKQLKCGADEAGFDMPALLLTVVGSAPESATWMVRRLQATAMSQLSVSIELDRVLSRIDSDVQCNIYLRFDDVGCDVEEALRLIDRSVGAQRMAAKAAARESAPPRVIPSATNGHHHHETASASRANGAAAPGTASEPARVEAGEDAPAASQWDPVVRPAVAAATSRRIKLDPKPAQHRANSSDTRDPNREESTGSARPIGSLAAHVPGLTALELCSPRSEHVEVAVDTAGRLHLLAEEAHLRDLHIVEAWAAAHHELLTMALGDRGIDLDAGITCHLFTDEPAAVADLHGTPIKLHVLAPVEVEGRQGWYAAALNR